MNRNDAFSSLCIGGYNNFLRLRIAEDGFDVFAVGLEDVPSRDDWIANPKHKQGHPDPEQPVFIPKVDLKSHLIEKGLRTVFRGATSFTRIDFPRLVFRASDGLGWFSSRAIDF